MCALFTPCVYAQLATICGLRRVCHWFSTFSLDGARAAFVGGNYNVAVSGFNSGGDVEPGAAWSAKDFLDGFAGRS